MQKKIIKRLKSVLDNHLSEEFDYGIVEPNYQEACHFEHIISDCNRRMNEGNKEYGNSWKDKDLFQEADEEGLDFLNYLTASLEIYYSNKKKPTVFEGLVANKLKDLISKQAELLVELRDLQMYKSMNAIK